MAKLKQIVEGWKNNLTPTQFLDAQLIKIADERMSICQQCEEYSSNKKGYSSMRIDAHCTNCGCTLSAKTKCLTCECPLKKWLSTSINTEDVTTT
jgi:hypothetical protein